MSIFRRIFKFYLDASVHVALAVVSLYWVGTEDLQVPDNGNLSGFLFFATMVCYNFVKYGVEAEKYLIVAKPYHKPIQRFSFLAFGLSLFFMFQLKPKLWAPIVVLTMVSALYAIPFLPRSKNLRSLGWLKMVVVALVWTGFTLWFPILDNGLSIGRDRAILLIQRFLFVFILILPFEIRDLKYDKPELGTLPQRIGVERTKVLGYIVTGCYFLMIFFTTVPSLHQILTSLIFSLLLLFVIFRAQEEQSQYFASFWVEGIPIVMTLIVRLT